MDEQLDSDTLADPAAELIRRNAELERELERQTALVHEVDHRVKNNLQLISSLILLQSRRTDDEAAKKTLRGMLERVSAIAAVHRRLFESPDPTRFDVAEFIRDLTPDLIAGARRDDVSVRLDLQRVEIPASQAAAFALVYNELVGNALKHAFPPGRAGVISVAVHTHDGSCTLSVADDGVGAPPDAPRGFGATILQLLSQQLRAAYVVEDAQPGRRASVSMPLPASQAA